MGDPGSTILLFAVMGAALYFLMIRPQQKRQKEQQKLMSSLEPGVRVMLLSGIFATIKYVGDKQAVVEIAPGVEMTVDKRAISPQPVEDEFEYEDDSEGAPAEPEDETVAEVVETEPDGFVEAAAEATTDQAADSETESTDPQKN